MIMLDHQQYESYAREIVRAFGLDLEVDELMDDRARRALVKSLEKHLARVKPVATAPAIGEILTKLGQQARKGDSKRHITRQLAELEDLVAAGTFKRTRRAARERIFAVLLLVFGLVELTGVDTRDRDAEAIVKLVRRARRE